MSWSIQFTRAARKQFDAIASKERSRIGRYLAERVANHPDPKTLAKRLVGKGEFWRFRVGNYRVICRFEDEKLVILIVGIGHRREVYR